MAWTAPITWVSGAILTADQLNEQVRDNELELAPFFATWTTFTPTLSGGWANGNATTTGKYLKIGRWVNFYAEIVLGSTTTKGAGSITVSLPVTAATVPNRLTSFGANLLDAGNADYLGMPYIASTTNLNINVWGAAGTYAQSQATSSTVPFTWGTNDVISYAGFYEAAT